MEVRKWTIGQPISDECPEDYLDEQAKANGAHLGYQLVDNGKVRIWQWHVFDKQGYVHMSDNSADEDYWATVATRHLEQIAKEEALLNKDE